MAKGFRDIRSTLIGCAIMLAVSTLAPLAGDLPNSEITPGFADPELTRDVLCAPGFSTRAIWTVAALIETSTMTGSSLKSASWRRPCHLSRKRKVVTIRPLHRFFALCVSPFFSGLGAKVARSHNVGGKPQWDGVKHIQDLSIVCGSVSIAFGMNEEHFRAVTPNGAAKAARRSAALTARF
jgi:hypothetical protein